MVSKCYKEISGDKEGSLFVTCVHDDNGELNQLIANLCQKKMYSNRASTSTLCDKQNVGA